MYIKCLTSSVLQDNFAVLFLLSGSFAIYLMEYSKQIITLTILTQMNFYAILTYIPRNAKTSARAWWGTRDEN